MTEESDLVPGELYETLYEYMAFKYPRRNTKQRPGDLVPTSEIVRVMQGEVLMFVGARECPHAGFYASRTGNVFLVQSKTLWFSASVIVGNQSLKRIDTSE